MELREEAPPRARMRQEAVGNSAAVMTPTRASSMRILRLRVKGLPPRLGRIRRVLPKLADLLAADAELTFGSDWPASAPDANPWTGLAGMLTRRSVDPKFPGTLASGQAISLMEALPIFTLNGARSMRMEHETGSSEAGKWADFVILNKSLLETQPMDVAAIRPQETYWKGQAVISADQ